MRRRYQEGAIPFKELPLFVSQVMASLTTFDMRATFESCGYGVAGCFDSSRAFKEVVDVTSRGVLFAEGDG